MDHLPDGAPVRYPLDPSARAAADSVACLSFRVSLEAFVI
jgi:hypothetical protein